MIDCEDPGNCRTFDFSEPVLPHIACIAGNERRQNLLVFVCEDSPVFVHQFTVTVDETGLNISQHKYDVHTNLRRITAFEVVEDFGSGQLVFCFGSVEHEGLMVTAPFNCMEPHPITISFRADSRLIDKMLPSFWQAKK